MLTSFGSDRRLFPAVQAGAIGYLLKDASPEELLSGIRHAAEGRTSLHPSIARRLLAELAGHEERAKSSEALTQREVELLNMVARGLTNDQIAQFVDTSDDWIFSRSGIRERRIAEEHETTASLASRAAFRALDRTNLRPRQIDLIIVATSRF